MNPEKYKHNFGIWEKNKTSVLIAVKIKVPFLTHQPNRKAYQPIKINYKFQILAD